jgi:hypothetical protein
VKAERTGIYEKWKKNTHRKVSLSGRDEDDNDTVPHSGFSRQGDFCLEFINYNFVVYPLMFSLA